MPVISEKILNNRECNKIKKYILMNEKIIKRMGPDMYSATSEDSLTGRYYCFNFLNTKEVGDILIPKFKNIFQKLKSPVFIQCWANTFRKNEGIEFHKHGADLDFLCANLFISGPTKPGTTYYINGEFIDIENEIGVLTMFDSNLGHMVKPNYNDLIRVSIGLDIHSCPNDLKMFSDQKRFFKLF